MRRRTEAIGHPRPNTGSPRQTLKALAWVGGGLAVTLGALASLLALTDHFGWTTSAAPPTTASAPHPTSTAALRPTSASPYDAGWGPARETFTIEHPAPYTVLNSITNNPAQGDERNFVQVRKSDASNATYDDEMIVQAGDSVTVFAYVANDAADNFDSAPATVQGLRATTQTGFNSSTEHWIAVTLAAKNATSVWDGALLLSRKPIILSLHKGSARFYTAQVPGGFSVEDPVGTGALLGVARPDGQFPVGRASNGMEKGAGYLTFQVDVHAKS